MAPPFPRRSVAALHEGGDGGCRRVAREKVNVQRVLGHFRNGGIYAREPVVVIRYVEPVVFGDHHASAKEVGPEPLGLPTELRGIEDASDVIPCEGTDESLFAIGQLLATCFQ